MSLVNVTKIISGGQVGADRAGLDFAIERGIPHGGWCPLGRRAEDGTVPAKYKLQEANRPGYPYRTKLNVREADGTVVFTEDPPTRGSSMTIQACLDFGKPYLHLTPDMPVKEACVQFLHWLHDNGIKVLNVAGSRHEYYYGFARLILDNAHAYYQTTPLWPKTRNNS